MFAGIRKRIVPTLVVAGVGVTLAQAQYGQQPQHKPERSPQNMQHEQQPSRNQNRPMNPKSWDQIVQEMRGQGVNLEKAISTATQKAGGTAVSARVLTHEMQPEGQAGWSPGEKGQNAQSNQKQEQQPGQQASPNESEYRIEVICRTNDGKFKRVMINGRDGKVIGTPALTAYPQEQPYFSQAAGGRTGSAGGAPAVGYAEIATFRLMKCTALEDAAVKNDDNEDIGEITDFAIESQSGRVAYAALAFGGWLGIGEKLFAVPMRAIDFASPDRVVLNVSKQELKQDKGFDEDHWPLHANAEFAANAQRSSGNDEYALAANERRQRPEPGDDRSGDPPQITAIEKASDVVGKDVKNAQGEDLGEIEDLYIDPDRARVCLAVLRSAGDKLYAIPWQSLKTNQKDQTLVLDVSKSRLEQAPSAAETDRNKWDNPQWVVTVYEFYHAQPYWESRSGQQSRHPQQP